MGGGDIALVSGCNYHEPEIEVTIATMVDNELVAAFRQMVPQLSSSAIAPTAEILREIVSCPCNILLVAR
jgi:hypothetical protein